MLAWTLKPFDWTQILLSERIFLRFSGLSHDTSNAEWKWNLPTLIQKGPMALQWDNKYYCKKKT